MVQTGAEKGVMVQYGHRETEERIVPTWPSWTIKQAAEETGYHPEYLRRLCRLGKIEYARAGNVYLIRSKSLLEYIEQLDRSDGRTGPKGG